MSDDYVAVVDWKPLYDAITKWKIAAKEAEIAKRNSIAFVESGDGQPQDYEGVIDVLIIARNEARYQAKLRFDEISSRTQDVSSELAWLLLHAEKKPKGES